MICLQKIYAHDQFTHGLSISFKKRQKKLNFQTCSILYVHIILREGCLLINLLFFQIYLIRSVANIIAQTSIKRGK